MSGFLALSPFADVDGWCVARKFLKDVPTDWAGTCSRIFDYFPPEHHEELLLIVCTTSRQVVERGATIPEGRERIAGSIKAFARRKKLHELRDEHCLAWPCVIGYCDYLLQGLEDYLPQRKNLREVAWADIRAACISLRLWPAFKPIARGLDEEVLWSLAGVLGCGETPEAALMEVSKVLQQHRRSHRAKLAERLADSIAPHSSMHCCGSYD